MVAWLKEMSLDAVIPKIHEPCSPVQYLIDSVEPIGPVEIRVTRDDRGRGLFATKDLKAESLVLVSNAMSMARLQSPKDNAKTLKAMQVLQMARFPKRAYLQLPNEWPVKDMANSDKQFEAFFGALYRLAPHIEELLEKLVNADAPVTCVISDILMTAPTQSAAQKFGIPRIAFQPASLSILLFTHYILKGTVPLSRVMEVLSNKEKVKDDILATELSGLPTLKNGDILDFIDNNPFLYQLYVDALQESQMKSLAIAVNTFEELERDALRVDFGVPIYAVGPLG
ncbi:hypothetical protein L7F22_001901 [Adiantum nelumboides]|nr:hypothetical protein [Adiantum nelumboides]